MSDLIYGDSGTGGTIKVRLKSGVSDTDQDTVDVDDVDIISGVAWDSENLILYGNPGQASPNDVVAIYEFDGFSSTILAKNDDPGAVNPRDIVMWNGDLYVADTPALGDISRYNGLDVASGPVETITPSLTAGANINGFDIHEGDLVVLSRAGTTYAVDGFDGFSTTSLLAKSFTRTVAFLTGVRGLTIVDGNPVLYFTRSVGGNRLVEHSGYTSATVQEFGPTNAPAFAMTNTGAGGVKARGNQFRVYFIGLS